MLKKHKYFFGVSLTLLFFAIDWISKHYLAKVTINHTITIIPNFFNLVYVQNTGVAFGFLAHLSGIYRFIFLIAISAIVVIIAFYFMFEENTSKTLFIGLTMLAGGALGNLYDRIVHGYVLDFFDFYIKTYHYPAFNFADSFITVGILLILYDKISKKI
ncbi:signal peptidase II [Desulfurella sp.]|uniref:signal peptidase II n=1 Tax=Desulfurella sp. TaxID=1962857 RepID=UPI003D122D07